MLRNFDTDLDQVRVQQEHRATTQIVETVEVLPRPQVARTDLTKPETQWGWEEMRDYVVTNIEQRFGPFPHDSLKEASIFKAFLGRHGDKAPAIARHAFEVCDGRWAGAPIGVTRFCRNSDPFFAEVIVNRLVDEPVAGW
jgi:hypothetical protein